MATSLCHSWPACRAEALAKAERPRVQLNSLILSLSNQKFLMTALRGWMVFIRAGFSPRLIVTSRVFTSYSLEKLLVILHINWYIGSNLKKHRKNLDICLI